ncbi:MAG: IS1595 family transposase [Gammaproteobacteria bacterium]|nr:IS1595 family transposase [Gammaproteobacteria bacterium]
MKRANMSLAKRAEQSGRGPHNMAAIVGMKDRDSNQMRAEMVDRTDAETLQEFIVRNADVFAEVYTDDAMAYQSLPFRYKSIKHSICEYVREAEHTNGVESFWSMFKRAHKGTFHKMSPKHLNRYVQEFVGRHNLCEVDTLAQMASLALGLSGKRLKYRELIADNGYESGARS